MANKTQNLAGMLRRLPKALRSLDQLMVSKNEKVRFLVTKLVIDKCIPTDSINFDNSQHYHITTEEKNVRFDRLKNALAEGFIPKN